MARDKRRSIVTRLDVARQDGLPVDRAVSAAAVAAATAAMAPTIAAAHARLHAVTSALDHTFPGGATFLRADGTFATPAATPPGGSTTQVQFNDAGAFNGDAGLLYDKATDTLTVAGLLDLSGALAGQIKFPATPNASSDAHTLDAYEEGTWTPSLGGSSTTTAATGTYTRVGRLVYVRGNLIVNAIGTGSTGTMTGLPFAAATTTAAQVGFFAVGALSINWIGGVVSGASFFVTGTTAAGASASLPIAVFGNGTNIHFAACYEI